MGLKNIILSFVFSIVQPILSCRDCYFSVHGHRYIKCGNTSSTLHGKMGEGKKQKQSEWENQIEGKSRSKFLIFKRNRESRNDDYTEK